MMKGTLALLAMLTFAGSARADVPLQAPVQITVTGFKAKLEGGRVVMSWRRYRRPDFSSYALIKSEKNSDPSYPETPAFVTFSAPEGVSWEDGKLAAGTWNYRLVITTRYGDRWVSPVVAIVIGEGDLKRVPPVNSDFAD